MKTYSPTTGFTTPPENRGQIMTISYALDSDAEVILERIHDASDRSTEYRAYAYPRNDDGSWEPWNCAPKLGRRLGTCAIETEEVSA